MGTVRGRLTENITAITSMVILGLGFVALFAGFDYFFVIWILGFAVVLPIVAILAGEEEEEEGGTGTTWSEWSREQSEPDTTEGTTESTVDALATLRERYARGELTDEQFERKLDRLLRTESPEDAADWRRKEVEYERSE